MNQTFLVFTLLSLVTLSFTLKNGNTTCPNNLGRYCEIQVIQSQAQQKNSMIQRKCFMLRVQKNQKKIAYDLFHQKLHKIFDIAEEMTMIPYKEALPVSKIDMKYLEKKRFWSFSASFMLIGTSAELKETTQKLKFLGIKILNFIPKTFQADKITFLELFANAKVEASKQIESIGRFRIIKTDHISVSLADFYQQKTLNVSSLSSTLPPIPTLKTNSPRYQSKSEKKILMRIVFVLEQKEQELFE